MSPLTTDTQPASELQHENCDLQPVTPDPVLPPQNNQPSTIDNPLFPNNGSFRVKEERALIHRRTVEPASSEPEPSTFNLQPSTSNPLEAVISAPPTANAHLSQRMRNGKIARLPKLERDLVNKLLHNHVPYSKIVSALSERDITVTERNISNWKTRGGYKEWCAEQDNQLRLAHIQDHLTDYLRKHDAQQLPEVGLQVASTQITSLLMNPQTAAPLLSDPNKIARIVDSLDKCSARLAELQKERYENLRRAGIRDSIQNLRAREEKNVECLREFASASRVAPSPRERNTPHRNDLPPREVMPYREPAPSFGEILERHLPARAKSQKRPDGSSIGALPVVSGNRTVTE